MKKFFGRSVSALAVTVMLGGFALAHPAFAVDDTTGTDQAQPDVRVHKGGIHRVDERIKELHEKIGVTAREETKWKPVARIMRQNEDTIHHLVEARNDKVNMNAVEDLKSYQKIAVAHEEGLKKLVPAFERFYNSLSQDQKQTADNIFSNYEGRDNDRTGNANQFNNIRPSSGDTDNTTTNGVNGNVNNGNVNNGTVPAPTSDTGTTENPSNPSTTTPSDTNPAAPSQPENQANPNQ